VAQQSVDVIGYKKQKYGIVVAGIRSFVVFSTAKSLDRL
jgi:hypothetical protein